MTDISTGTYVEPGQRAAVSDPDAATPLSSILGAVMIIGLPAVFWLSAMEFANYLFSWGLSSSVRWLIAALLIGLLSFVWGFIDVSARQRDSARLDAQLK